MARRRALAVVGLIALAALPGRAFAQPSSIVPGLHLSFAQPTGTGTTSSVFDVILRLSLDPGADPFIFDGSSAAPWGLPAGTVLPADGTYQFPLSGSAPFAKYTTATTTVTEFGEGTFVSSGQYSFNFFFDFVSLGSFTLLPGNTFDFAFGRFTPTSATPGTYTFFDASTDIATFGEDVAGNPMYAVLEFAHTCENLDPTCAFSRTITADAGSVTPEPGTFGLIGLGLGVVGIVRRRRSRPRGTVSAD